ncbi:MAG TPA: hypothetical protein VL524_09415 [Gemmatimonadaceae bacterium]|nr:hypothetical protein [Gemmatimonadaceae bacterium]
MRIGWVGVAVVCLAAWPAGSSAQARVEHDSTRRLAHFMHAAKYGIVEGLAYSGVDQMRENPPEWGRGWPGYERRAASNVGEFLIQESVSEGLAAVMHRPLNYQRCRCRSTEARIGSALRGAVTDQMPNGSHPLAVPRIVGAYTGSFAQASWRPSSGHRTRTALVNGTSSLALGVLINLYHEFRR